MTILNSKIININNHKTSLRLALGEWEAIDIICNIENIKRNSLFELININRNTNLNLTSSIRLFCISYLLNESLKPQNYKKISKNNSSLEKAIANII